MSAGTMPPWFARALDALLAGDVPGFIAMYDDDAIHEFPFAPEGRPKRLEGKPAIAQYMKNLPAMVKYESFDDLRVREVGDELIVEATARGKRVGTGAAFDRQWVWFITHQDGHVSRFRDYMKPLQLRST